MTGWTDERVEQLKALWDQGFDAKSIAKRLGGVTRNAVIGKVHRLGLPSNSGVMPQPLTAADRQPDEGTLEFRHRVLTQDVRLAIAEATSLAELKQVLDGLITSGVLKLHFPMG